MSWDGRVMLTKTEARRAITLLGKLQGYLEELIDSVLVEGESQPRDENFKLPVRLNRAEWRRADDLIMKLSGGKSRKKIRA